MNVTFENKSILNKLNLKYYRKIQFEGSEFEIDTNNGSFNIDFIKDQICSKGSLKYVTNKNYREKLLELNKKFRYKYKYICKKFVS